MINRRETQREFSATIDARHFAGSPACRSTIRLLLLPSITFILLIHIILFYLKRHLHAFNCHPRLPMTLLHIGCIQVSKLNQV